MNQKNNNYILSNTMTRQQLQQSIIILFGMTSSLELSNKYGIIKSSHKFQTVIRGSPMLERTNIQIKLSSVLSVQKMKNKSLPRLLPYSKKKKSFDSLSYQKKRRSAYQKISCHKSQQLQSIQQTIFPQIINKKISAPNKLELLQQKRSSKIIIFQKSCQSQSPQFYRQDYLKPVSIRKTDWKFLRRNLNKDNMITNHGWNSDLFEKTIINITEKN